MCVFFLAQSFINDTVVAHQNTLTQHTHTSEPGLKRGFSGVCVFSLFWTVQETLDRKVSGGLALRPARG